MILENGGIDEINSARVLKSMGYREVKEGKWLKPCGFGLFTFSEFTGCFISMFLLGDGSIGNNLTFNISDCKNDEEFLANIKLYEALDNSHNWTNDHFSSSRFEFLSKQDLLIEAI